MMSLVAAINDRVTEFSFNLPTFLSSTTMLKKWINSTFSDIVFMQKFKHGTARCKYNKSIYLSYIPKYLFRGKFYSKYYIYKTCNVYYSISSKIFLREDVLECSLKIWMSLQNLIKIYSFDTFHSSRTK